jgi:putative heme iron utilization protein
LLAGEHGDRADGAPLLLISRLAVHTKNILADPRVSVMIDERKEGDPLQGARIMLMGSAAATDDPDIRRRYLDRQPRPRCSRALPISPFTG